MLLVQSWVLRHELHRLIIGNPKYSLNARHILYHRLLTRLHIRERDRVPLHHELGRILIPILLSLLLHFLFLLAHIHLHLLIVLLQGHVEDVLIKVLHLESYGPSEMVQSLYVFLVVYVGLGVVVPEVDDAEEVGDVGDGVLDLIVEVVVVREVLGEVVLLFVKEYSEVHSYYYNRGESGRVYK